MNDYLFRFGGHVGYAVAPSFRRKGYATEMLRQTLPIAGSVGLKRILLTCDDDNVASQRVIELNGGVLENVVWIRAGQILDCLALEPGTHQQERI